MTVHHEREGVSLGLVVGIIVAALLVLAVLWFALGPGMGTGAPAAPTNNQPNININPPAAPEAPVMPDGGGVAPSQPSEGMPGSGPGGTTP